MLKKNSVFFLMFVLLLFFTFLIFFKKKKSVVDIKKEKLSKISLSFDKIINNIPVHKKVKYQIIRFEKINHISTINYLRYFDNGRKLISSSKDGLIRLWQVSDSDGLRLLQSFFVPLGMRNNFLSSMAISSDYRMLAVGGKLYRLYLSHNIIIYHLDRGKVSYIPNTVPVSSIAFGKYGRFLVYGMVNGEVKILYNLHWKKNKKGWIFKYDKSDLDEYPLSIKKITVSDDKIAIASTDGLIRIYNIFKKVKLSKTIDVKNGSINDLIFTNNGKHLIGLYDNSIIIFDKEGAFFNKINYLYGIPKVINISPDDSKIIVGFENGEIAVYSLPEGKIIKKFNYFDSGISAISSTIINNRLLIAATGGTQHKILLFDETGKKYNEVFSPGREIKRIGYMEKKKIGFSYNKENRDMDTMENNDLGQAFDINQLKISDGFDNSKYDRAKIQYDDLTIEHKPYFMESIGLNFGLDTLEIQRDGKPFARIIRSGYDGGKHLCYSFIDNYYLVSGGQNGTLSIYSVKGEKVADLVGHKDDITDVVPSENARSLVASSMDKTFSVWFFGDKYITEKKGKKKFQINWKEVSFFYSNSKIKLLKKKLDEFERTDKITYRALKNYLINLSYYSRYNFPIKGYFKIANGFIYPFGKEKLIIWNNNGLFSLNQNNMWNSIGFEVSYGRGKRYVIYLSQIYKRYYFSTSEFYNNLGWYRLLPKRDLIAFPDIKCVSPKDGEIVSSQYINIKFKLENPKHGGFEDRRVKPKNIRIKIYNNGKLVLDDKLEDKMYNIINSDNKSKGRIYTKDKYSIFSFKIPVVFGNNIISYRLYKEGSKLYSKSKSIRIKLNLRYEKPKLYFLIVGNDEFYQKQNNLKYTKSDINALDYYMRDNYNNYYDEILVKKKIELTKKKMFELLDNYKNLIKPKDTFIFYFISNSMLKHNHSLIFFTKEKDKCYGLYKDNLFYLQELKEKIEKIEALNQIIIFDTECLDEQYYKKNSIYAENEIVKFAYDTGASAIFSAVSKELSGAFGKYNLITYCILKGLEGNADFNNDNKIVLRELSQYIKRSVKFLVPRKFSPILINCDKDIPIYYYNNKN